MISGWNSDTGSPLKFTKFEKSMTVLMGLKTEKVNFYVKKREYFVRKPETVKSHTF